MLNPRRRRMAWERGFAAGVAAGRAAHSITVMKGEHSLVFRLPVDAFALSPILEFGDVKIFVIDEHDVRVQDELPPLPYSGWRHLFGNFYRTPRGLTLVSPGHPMYGK